ncbi:MAG TPA: hypothetical protein VKI17_13870 [Gemmataceae bacterium]|nr:hypothetical protein [Gemmataceae bacterium]
MPTYNLPDPSGRTPRDNCVACVSACLLYEIQRIFWTAQDLDGLHHITQRMRGSEDPVTAMRRAVQLIQEATGLRVVPNEAGRPFRHVRFNDLPEGHYAIFDLGPRSTSALIEEPETVVFHVIYGRARDYRDRRRVRPSKELSSLFDPQASAVRHIGNLGEPSYAVQFEGPA